MQVAPIYADPWTKETFLANAIIVTIPHWSKTQTIGGVTCTLYLVRYFYSEALKETYIDVLDIADWTDLQVHNLSLTGCSAMARLVNLQTELIHNQAAAGTSNQDAYIPIGPWPLEDKLASFQCYFAHTGPPTWDTYVQLRMYAHISDNPGDAAALVGDVAKWGVSLSYTLLKFTIPTPPSPPPNTQLSLRIVTHLTAPAENAAAAYCKAFSTSTIRTI